MNTIKRLRVKSTEDQKSIEDINKKLSKIEKDNADSQEKIKKLVETDRRQKEQIKSLSKLQIERNAALTSVSQLQSQLTELSARMEKNIENALQESSDREQRAQKELQDTIGRLRTESDNVQAQTMNELRRVTSELERSIATELELRREISDLENQLEIQRYRAEETSERYLNAGQNELTHKLESTRNQYSQSSLKWQQTEARLNALYDQLRLEKVDLELQKTQAWDKLRDMTDKVTITSDAQCRAETSLENLRKEYEIVTDSNRMKDDEISHLLTKIENLEQNLTQISTSSDHSAPHLSIERCNSISPPDEMSMKNSKEFPLPRIDSSSAIPDILEEHQVMSPDRRPSKMTFETYGPGTSIPPQDTISVQTANAGSVSIGIIERMSTAMRKLEGDLALSRQEILRLSSQRDEVRAACLELSKELEIRKSIEKKNIELQKQVFGLEERFHATLELLGEKSETIEEMQQDIIDLKAMYKEQIQE
ncbi:Protein SGM1, partial [Neolecta irregularis DAH-3]